MRLVHIEAALCFRIHEHVLGFDEGVQFYTANKRMDSGCNKEQKLWHSARPSWGLCALERHLSVMSLCFV